MFDLTSLQREANRQLGFTAQQTLDYTQALYEKKLVTYPRTDSRYLTDDMAPLVPELVSVIQQSFQIQADVPAPVNAAQVINSKKVTDHHSLSVSDIVALRQNGVVSCHYVDSIGFQELPGFLKPEKYLKAAEKAMEDDYGMIDGVINNGKKEEPVEKASVLDQLKEKQEAVPPAPPRRCCEEKEL